MNHYSIALFLHIVGAMGFFATLGIEWTAVWRLRQASTIEQVREWVSMIGVLRRVAGLSMLVLMLSGFDMMHRVWGQVAWIMVALAAVVGLMILAMVFNGRHIKAIKPMIAGQSGGVGLSLQQLLRQPRAWLTMQVRLAVTLGIVFLMTVKPSLSGSLAAIGVAVLVGLIPTIWRMRGAQGLGKLAGVAQ